MTLVRLLLFPSVIDFSHLKDNVQPDDRHKSAQTRLMPRRLIQNLVLCDVIIIYLEWLWHVAIPQVDNWRPTEQRG